MLPLATEWVAKVEGDWDSALREYRARIRPNYDSSCFHAQQCAEKYLKARLEEGGVPFPPTHNLVHLIQLALPLEPVWSTLTSTARALTVYAVGVRYPGTMADRLAAREAIAHCRLIRASVRDALGLPE
jgi:HEPN domain-containing protein